MPKSISLAMIVKRSDEEKAKKAIASVYDYVDEICITIADKSESELPKKEDKKIKYSYFKWNDNFADARNYNFSRCTSDWILWLDADDTLKGAEKLKELIDLAEEHNVKGYAFLYKYNFDENGNCIDEHWKTQLLKNDGHFKWQGAIHEDPIQQVPVNWVKTQDCVRIHHSTGERVKESYDRNLRILKKEAKKKSKEPRTKFYLGRTYFAAERYQEAVDVLMEYLDISGWSEERYEARLLIGNTFFQTGQTEEALQAYNDAILEMERYPDAYIYKGMCYLKDKKYREALQCYEIATQKKRPEANTYYNPMLYSQKLTGAMAICYMNIGEFDKALAYIQYCYKANPKDRDTIYTLKLIQNIKEKTDTAKAYNNLAERLAKRGNEDNIGQILHGVPVDLQDNPFIVSLRSKYTTPRKWGDKTITVYCGDSAEVWNPKKAEKGGIGGSETAVIELTKRLKKKGWDVTVYCKCDAEPVGTNYDGVLYKNYWEFNPQDEFNTLWVWRLPELFDYNIKAKFSILDLHDVMNPLDFSEERLSKIDKIFVKTKYHRSLTPNIPDDKFEIIPNGINYTRFKKEVEKEPYRFIYSSTPNRGLDIILEYIWDDIKKELPEAELHTYYGFNTFYELEKHNPERMAWMKKMEKLMEKPGVVNHGRVSQKELSKDILKSSYWLYPTYFPEIHCITACEMQAGGVIPITSGYAALEETVRNGITVEGDVYDPEYHKKYVKEVVKQVKKDNSELINKAIKEAAEFDWDNVADQWNDKIYEKNNQEDC